jgi:dTMP kinase
MKIIPNFVVFEGSDGSGTTTQLSMLTERLKNIQKPVFFSTFEPTDGKIGNLIRDALKRDISIQNETLAFLFAADRHEHLSGSDGIVARAGRSELVICDRYVLSSLVYQGIDCGDELPVQLNSHFPAPELTIFLDIKPEIALERTENRSSREIYEYLDFQVKVYEKYITVIEMYKNSGARVEILDASKSIQEIADQVWSLIWEMPIFKI